MYVKYITTFSPLLSFVKIIQSAHSPINNSSKYVIIIILYTNQFSNLMLYWKSGFFLVHFTIYVESRRRRKELEEGGGFYIYIYICIYQMGYNIFKR